MDVSHAADSKGWERERSESGSGRELGWGFLSFFFCAVFQVAVENGPPARRVTAFLRPTRELHRRGARTVSAARLPHQVEVGWATAM